MRWVVVFVALTVAGCVSPFAPQISDPPVVFDAVRVETAAGSFTAILFCDETPLTCVFFRGLVERGYYDGRAFGRTIPGFVIQEVDRTGGTTDQTDSVGAEFGTAVNFSAGSFGIARNADPDSGSSEFFVMDFATSRLYGNYTAFAQIVDDLDVVHAIARAPAVRTGPASGADTSAFPVPFGVHDRVPVDPVEMTAVSMTTIEMSSEQAGRYPLQVGETFTSSALRATLEWPADLRSGSESRMSWYVSPRDMSATASFQDGPPIDLSGATIRFDGASRGTLAFSETPTAPGALEFTWAPLVAGSYQFHLEQRARAIAVANLTVAR